MGQPSVQKWTVDLRVSFPMTPECPLFAGARRGRYYDIDNKDPSLN